MISWQRRCSFKSYRDSHRQTVDQANAGKRSGQVGMLLLDVIMKKLDWPPLGVFLNERQDRCWLISIRKEIC